MSEIDSGGEGKIPPQNTATTKLSNRHGAKGNSRRGFWVGSLWFGRETFGAVAILSVGLLLVYLGAMKVSRDHYCVPDSPQQLTYLRGTLLEVQRSIRLGDLFVVEVDGSKRTFPTAVGEVMARWIGSEIRIGTYEGLVLCPVRVMHIELAGLTVLDSTTAIRNLVKGRWMGYVMLVLAWSLAVLPLIGGFKLLSKKSHELRSQFEEK